MKRVYPQASSSCAWASPVLVARCGFRPTPRGWLAACLLVALSGCAFGPGGQPPVLPQPDQYGVMPAAAQTAQAQGRTQHFIASTQPAQQWWRSYGNAELDAMVDEALVGNLDLAAARHRLAAAREQWSAQSGATQMPSVDLGAQASRQRQLGLPIQGLPQTSLYNTFVGQAQVQYTFDLFGANRYKNQALADRVSQQAEELEAARNAVAANVVSGAISLAGLQSQISVLQSLIALARADQADAIKQYELGAVSRSAMLDAGRGAAALSAQLPELQAQALAARHALSVLLGRRPDQAPPPLNLANFSLPDRLPVVVPSALLASRPDIRAADAALKAAASDVGAATADMFPRITLSASMGRGGFDWSTATSGAGAIWALASSISAPVFHGGALRAQRRAAQQNYEAAVAAYKNTVLSAFQEVADSLAGLEQVSDSLAQSEAAQNAAREMDQRTRQQVRLGALPAVAARAMSRQAAQANLDALRYETNRLLDTTRLFHAMGALPAPDNQPARP